MFVLSFSLRLEQFCGIKLLIGRFLKDFFGFLFTCKFMKGILSKLKFILKIRTLKSRKSICVFQQ